MYLISQSGYKRVPLFPILKNECIDVVFHSDEHFDTFFSDIFFQLQNLEKKV